MSNPKLATLYIYIISTVAAPQLTNVVLASFRNGTFELSLQYDQQVGRHAVYMLCANFQPAQSSNPWTCERYLSTLVNLEAFIAFVKKLRKDFATEYSQTGV